MSGLEPSIVFHGLWPVAKRLPGWAIRRHFTAQRLSELVYVDLYPRNQSAVVDLGSSPSFELHVQAINLSPFEVELDRAEFRFYCAGICLTAAILKKQSIASGGVASLFVRGTVGDGQASQIASLRGSNHSSLEGNIEFNCRIRSFPKTLFQLSGVQVSFQNADLRGGVT